MARRPELKGRFAAIIAARSSSGTELAFHVVVRRSATFLVGLLGRRTISGPSRTLEPDDRNLPSMHRSGADHADGRGAAS